jgi:hypothetical protein
LFCICPKSLYSCGFSGVFCVRRNPRRNRRNPAFSSGGARRRPAVLPLGGSNAKKPSVCKAFAVF